MNQKENETKNYKPVIVLKDMSKRGSQPDWIAIILVILGVVAVYKQNQVGFIFIIFGLIKYFWTLKNG
jgi:hypothetical protein